LDALNGLEAVRKYVSIWEHYYCNTQQSWK
jgi:hypothetical protein